MKVNVADSCCMLAVINGGTSLMTHNKKAEGIDEPRNTRGKKEGYLKLIYQGNLNLPILPSTAFTREKNKHSLK